MLQAEAMARLMGASFCGVPGIAIGEILWENVNRVYDRTSKTGDVRNATLGSAAPGTVAADGHSHADTICQASGLHRGNIDFERCVILSYRSPNVTHRSQFAVAERSRIIVLIEYWCRDVTVGSPGGIEMPVEVEIK